jgi:hypothetical protein
LPSITSGPEAVDITITSATIIWETDRNTTGIVFVGTTSGVYPLQGSDVLTPTLTSHSVDLNFLVRGTTYYYKVRSTDSFGNTIESAEQSFSSGAGDVTPPIITTGPSVAQTSASQVTISWVTDELSSSVVEYGIQSPGESQAGRPDERSLFHQVTLLGLIGNQSYRFHVKSQDPSGNTVVSENQVLTTVSSPGITEVRITDITLNSAVVQWRTTVPSSTAARYGVSSGAYTGEAEDAALTETHVLRLSGLVNGTVYYLRLSGADGSGSVLTSDEYLFKTVILPTINAVQIVNVRSRNATLRWTASTEVDAFVRYRVTRTEDQSLVGKDFATGDDKLAISHEIELTNLEADSEYSVSVLGKDVFGNQAISPAQTFTTEPDREKPVIENLRSDTTVDLGTKQSVQVLVSFGLSELGKAVIQYGPGASGDYTQTVITDTDYTTNKFLVIPGLKPGDSYHFRVVATDRSSNVTESPDYLVLAPLQPVSLLDLIFGQIRANFGWLQNLGS